MKARRLPFSLQFGFILLSILLLFAALFASLSVTANFKLELQKFDSSLIELMDAWHRLQQLTYRLVLSEDTAAVALADGRKLYGEYASTVEAFRRNKPDGLFMSADTASRLESLMQALDYGSSVIYDPYAKLEEFIKYNEAKGNALFLEKSLFEIFRDMQEYDSADYGILYITWMQQDIKDMGYSFSDLLETKQREIRESIQRRSREISGRYDIIQASLGLTMGAVLLLLVWRLLVLNRSLVRTVDERTEELSKTLENLKETQQVLLETKHQAGLTSVVVGLSHEINTPLGVALMAQTKMVSNLESIAGLDVENAYGRARLSEWIKTQRELGELLGKNIDRIISQVDYFRNLSVDQQDFEDREVDLPEYLGPLFRHISENAAKSGIEVHPRIRADKKVYTCPSAIAQIAGSLVDNCVIHAFPPGFEGRKRVDLSVSVEGDHIVLSCEDNGRGIPAEQMKLVLEPFFTTARASGHMGLGLNIVYNLGVQRMRGKLGFAAANPGLRVTLILPLAARGAPGERAREKQEAPGKPTGAAPDVPD